MAGSTTTKCLDNTYGPGGGGGGWGIYAKNISYIFFGHLCSLVLHATGCLNCRFCSMVLVTICRSWLLSVGPGRVMLKCSFLLTGPGGVMPKF